MVNGPKQAIAYVYGHADKRDAEIAKSLTLDEVRRIASNIAKLPSFLMGAATQRLIFAVRDFLCVRFGALEEAAPADFSPRGQAPPSALVARARKIYSLIVRQWKSSISRCGAACVLRPRVGSLERRLQVGAIRP